MAYMNDPLQKKNQEDQTQNQNQNSGGNIYSTSSSEVSSQVDQKSSPSGNSNNSNTSSNSSGNWVNLNSYLDANQDKVGRYVDNLVNPYSSKENSYKNSIQENSQKYISDVNKNNENMLSVDDQADFAKRIYSINGGGYIPNSEKTTEDERQKAYNTYTGYQGPRAFESSGNEYGYNENKNQRDIFDEVGSNLTNQNYQRSLMNKNTSTGGKNLNSFLIAGTDQGRNAIQDYSKQFSDLATLLDTEAEKLNQARNTEVAESKNRLNNLKNAMATEKQKAKDYLTTERNKAKQKGAEDRALVEQWNREGLTPNEYSWNDRSAETEANYTKEMNILDQLEEELKKGNTNFVNAADLAGKRWLGLYDYGDIIDNVFEAYYQKLKEQGRI